MSLERVYDSRPRSIAGDLLVRKEVVSFRAERSDKKRSGDAQRDRANSGGPAL
jgi:hypothetical protein